MKTMLLKKNLCVFSPRTLFVATGMTLIIVSDLFYLTRYRAFGYIDEIFSVICLVVLLMNIVRLKKLPKMYLYFIILIPLGLFGNLFSREQTDIMMIAADAFIFCKPYILMLYILTVVKEYQARELYTFVTFISKTLIIILFASSIANLIFDLNMNNQRGEFQFVTEFTGTVSMWTILFLAVIVSNKDNHRFLYFLMSAIIIFLTVSGLGMLSIVGLIVVYIFLEKRKKFRWYYLLLIVPLGFWVGREEIIGYLMNREAPRFLLFYYSFVTAFRFFPFGSGFATYASAIARREYSALYYDYGFNDRWGMRADETFFLTDSYYPQIIGQLGLIGAILFCWFMYLVFKKIIWKESRYIRNASLYLFAIWAIAGLGFGISSSWGCIVYIVLAMLYLMDLKSINPNATC